MIKDAFRTKVVFRAFRNDGSIIALFPNEIADNQGNYSSYMHVGQHGAANYAQVMKITKATAEYGELRKELESIGYDLDIKMRK